MSTKTKITLAGLVQRVVMLGLSLRGQGPKVLALRGGIKWRLDLREGIDFAIYLLGAFEPATNAAYRKLIRPPATILDIGANIGAHTLPLARATGASGRVIAIEPTTYAFERLQDQLSLNPDIRSRVTARQAMLMSSVDAKLAPAIPSSWPLITPKGAHRQHLGVDQSTDGATVTTVDALADDLMLTSLDLIKLDVDGYELEVLRGAQRVLQDFRPIILFEHSPYTLEEKGYDPHEMIKLLKKAGYRFRNIKGKLFGGDGQSVPWVPIGAGINVIAIAEGISQHRTSL